MSLNFAVLDQTVEVKVHGVEHLKERNQNFNGQKLLHPFVTDFVEVSVESVNQKTGKKNVRKFKEMVYTDKFVSEEAKNDLENALFFEMKHDGSCGYVRFVDGKYVPYARYDVKKGKDGFGPSPADSLPCEPMPTDEQATHWPHFVPCFSSPSAYKWHLEAFNKMMESGVLQKLEGQEVSFTCEYMGKKFNYKSTDPVEAEAVVVPHGLVTFDLPRELRSYQGLLALFKAFPTVEGVVVYGSNNTWKVRRSQFLDESKPLEWPNSYSKSLSQLVALV